MDNKEEKKSGNDDGSPNSQEVDHPQMPIQKLQLTHMANQARGQRPRLYQRFDHRVIVGRGPGGSRIQALPNMQNIQNMGHQLGASSLHGSVAYHQRRVEPYMRAMHFERFGGLSGPISVGSAMSSNNEIIQQLQQLSLSSAQLQFGAPTGGQPDLQQETQEPVAGESTQSEHRKLIQQQLVLLLHAHKCQLRERQANGEARICALPHCKTMKNVLTHMTTCEEGKECTTPHCSSSRQLITHWKQCQKSDCPVCLPLKQADKNKAANSPVAASQPTPNPDIRKHFDTMGIIQSQNDTYGILSNLAVGRGVRMPGPGMQGPPGSMAAEIRLAQPQAQQSPSQSVLNQGQPMTGPLSALAASAGACLQRQAVNMIPGDLQLPQASKEWQQSVKSNLRDDLVHKLVQAIFPAPDLQAMFDKRIHKLVAYAKKVESYMFEKAYSKSEYYHLMAEQIYKIQKSHQKMRFAANSKL